MVAATSIGSPPGVRRHQRCGLPDRVAGSCTVTTVDPQPSGNDIHRDLTTRAKLMATPWVRSWVGRAHTGQIDDSNPSRRASAWAAWAVENLVEVSNGERTYPALRLAGQFYDPRGNGPQLRPHLEVPRRVMNTEDPEFPDRLAQAGAAMSFPYWVYGEVIALRRALFNVDGGEIAELVDTLNANSAPLRSALTLASDTAAPHFDVVAAAIIADDGGLLHLAADDFTAADVAAAAPALAEFGLAVRFDHKLREANASWTSRRVGVWQLRGRTATAGEFALGVVTPRLTKNSLFADPMFRPEAESPAAALVRTLVLRRIISALSLGSSRKEPDPVADLSAHRPGGHLRAVAAKPGQKIPEASTAAAVEFLRAYPNPDAAWVALSEWSNRGYLLTITHDGFIAAHRAATRAVNRAEEPDRNRIDCVLPLAWDVREGRNQVVRVTFVAGS